MARRHVLAAVLVAVVATAGAMLAGTSTSGHAPLPAGATRLDPTALLEPPARPSADAIVAEQGERVTDAAQLGRRPQLRDGRPLDWVALAGLIAVGIAALSSALARRRSRRLATVARSLAPSRGPPRLLPS